MNARLPVQKDLELDALMCLAAGAVMLFATTLAPLTNLPLELLRYAGIALFPMAGLLGWLSRMRSIPLIRLWIWILGNIAWVAGSVFVVGWYDATLFGWLFVFVPAAIVLLRTIADWRGVTDARGTTA